MREIKLRAYSKESGMLYAPLVIASDSGALICLGYDGNGNEIELELMQFTGLTDKNGVEIYEGDVVKCRVRNGIYITRYIGEVKFSSVYCSFVAVGVKQYFRRKQKLHELHSMEVIGNIHQNLELLEK